MCSWEPYESSSSSMRALWARAATWARCSRPNTAQTDKNESQRTSPGVWASSPPGALMPAAPRGFAAALRSKEGEIQRSLLSGQARQHATKCTRWGADHLTYGQIEGAPGCPGARRPAAARSVWLHARSGKFGASLGPCWQPPKRENSCRYSCRWDTGALTWGLVVATKGCVCVSRPMRRR